MNPINAVIEQISEWQHQNQQVVLVTGVFDLIHIEHIRFLQKAKAAGDKLIVGLETDARVQVMKGSNRPIHTQGVRLEQIAALKSVDLVFLLPAEFSTQSDWVAFMKNLHPDQYAVSENASYIDNKTIICKACGIQFKIVHEYNPEYSSSKIAKKVLSLRD